MWKAFSLGLAAMQQTRWQTCIVAGFGVQKPRFHLIFQQNNHGSNEII
jgi:hypothetical protein